MVKQELLLIIPHEGFKFRPISFAKEGNFSGFLFLNGGFDSTGGSDHVMVTFKLLSGLGGDHRRRKTIPRWNSPRKEGILKGITVGKISSVL